MRSMLMAMLAQSNLYLVITVSARIQNLCYYTLHPYSGKQVHTI